MPHELTHASFFSGVGGLDLGLERAGWRTVSFSEIDPYASAVLAERWPSVPNLGDILGLRPDDEPRPSAARNPLAALEDRHGQDGGCRLGPGCTATLWSGGFPCQDLSVAGKRAGFTGERSSLAFAFLDLVEQHRPPAILLENVPGLLSSNGGRDFGTLLGRLEELGYGWAYRILDAQFFGVPQRRRRVFICALHAGAGFGADSAAAVLSVGSRCDGHSQAGDEAGERAAPSVAHSVTASSGHHGHSSPRGDGSDNLVSPSPDPGGVREADGLAGRLDDSPVAFTQHRRAGENDPSPESWGAGAVAATLDGNGHTARTATEAGERPDDLLPLGLDSHRYRCCGNGVVSNVSEWVGVRLAEAMA